MQTKNLQAIKQSNRARTLEFIRQREPISRREIARDLNLSPTTASAAVADLLETGFIREIGQGVSTGGRRPILLEINPKGGTIISVDIASAFNRRIIRAAALDLKSAILTEIKREQHIDSNEAMLATIRGIIYGLIASPDVTLRGAVAIGISVPGLVNAEAGELVFANINVKHLLLGPMLTDEFQVPVLLQNSEDAAALGEYRFGVGQGSTSLVYLSIGAGVGAGFVVNGRIYQHGRTSAGEIGHITVQPDGPVCGCGNQGCLSALVSSEMLVKTVRAALDGGYLPETAVLSSESLNIHQILAAAQAGEPLCLDIVTRAAEWVGIAIANIINFLNPEIIVCGGELFEKNDYFFSLVEQVVWRRALPDFMNAIHLTRSSLGRRAGLQGVAVLALDTLLKSPYLIVQ